jgi:hypothetical protein
VRELRWQWWIRGDVVVVVVVVMIEVVLAVVA